MTNSELKKVAAITFGCKINQYETSCILDDFESANYQVVDFKESADIYLINSCTVTARTDFKSRNAIRHALKEKAKNPTVKIVVTGCYSQLNYQNVKALGVDFVVDNNQKNNVLEILKSEEEHFSPISLAQDFPEQTTQKMYDRSRAFVKIQDGCDFYCHYCAIPYARGKSRSRDKTAVIRQIKQLAANGYREFVLSGINLGLYTTKDGEDVTDLLQEIEALPQVELIRLSSIEPPLVTDKLLHFYRQSQKICPHFHIPLQSGSDAVLQKMNRHYTTSEYKEILEKILEIRQDTAIGMDVITGLPTETDVDFDATYAFIESLPAAYLHVFSYSKRSGTIAAKMDGQNSKQTIRHRTRQLIALGEEKTKVYQQMILQKKITLRGIVEKSQSGRYSTLSDHYLRLTFEGNEQMEMKCLRFEPISIKNNQLQVNICD